jgi:hypothetical protein
VSNNLFKQGRRLVYDKRRDTHDSPLFLEGSTPNSQGCIGPEDGGVVGSSEWIWLSDEDAQRIVTCWNAHDTLIAALRAQIEFLESLVGTYRHHSRLGKRIALHLEAAKKTLAEATS